MDLWFYRSERGPRSVPRNKREPQAGPASGQSDSASKGRNASGDEVNVSEPNTLAPGTGEKYILCLSLYLRHQRQTPRNRTKQPSEGSEIEYRVCHPILPHRAVRDYAGTPRR